MNRFLVSAAVSAGLLMACLPTAEAAPKPPPPSKFQVSNVTAICREKANGNMKITGNARIDWYKAPKKKGPTTVGHYLRIKSQIMVQSGKNGTLWKSLAKKKYKNDRIDLPSVGLPGAYSAPVAYTAAHGTLNYRTKITARVIRDVRLSVDTTAWKGVYWSRPTTCLDSGLGSGAVS